MVKYLIEEESVFYHVNFFYKLIKRYDNYCIVRRVIWNSPIGYPMEREEKKMDRSENPYLWESKI
tara:strand:- start:295 stop:489 length:195 start_codon:yes stop_codon:yes gene_type:complete